MIQVLEAEPPGEDVVAKIEEALDPARQGKISSIAIAVVYRDGSTGNSWSNAPSLSALIGSVARLQNALIRTADGE